MPYAPHPEYRRRERGAALFVSLILLLVVTLIGLSAGRMQTVHEQMARNDDNRHQALQNAEAALRDSEIQYENGLYDGIAWDGSTVGTYTLADEVTTTGASVGDATGAAFDASSVAYGGPALPGAASPRFVMESLPPVQEAKGGLSDCGASYGSHSDCSIVRTTTTAVGRDTTASITLQSFIH